MANVRIWFPQFFTEYHKTPEHGQQLVEHLAEFGVECSLELDHNCDFIFCGGTWVNREVAATLKRHANHTLNQIPIIHYCWDLYPFNLAGEAYDPDSHYKQWWGEYVEHLNMALEVWVPSTGVVQRLKQLTRVKDPLVMRCSYRPWEVPEGIKVGGGDYVVNVMRKYPDRMRDAAEEACDQLGIHCVSPNHTLDWDSYRELISGARLLISAYDEASTGGLSLLEGAHHGIPSLVSDSPYNGAKEYLNPPNHEGWCFTFNHLNSMDLETSINVLFHEWHTNLSHRASVLKSRLPELLSRYSEREFAQRIASRLVYLKEARHA